jgi:four helix bundle protein
MENVKFEKKQPTKREELIERFLIFAVTVYKLEKEICTTYSGRHVYGQLFRAATSVGANYDEASKTNKDSR